MKGLFTAAKSVRDEYDLVGNIMAYESGDLGCMGALEVSQFASRVFT